VPHNGAQNLKNDQGLGMSKCLHTYALRNNLFRDEGVKKRSNFPTDSSSKKMTTGKGEESEIV
jgi:hypothetical protein